MQAGEKGHSYVADHISSRGSFFLIELEHKEGEFAVGLGRRTFDADVDNEDKGLYEIEWFERKNKRVDLWGFQPGFKLTVGSYTRERKPISITSVEPRSKFLPIVVSIAPSSKEDEPALTRDTLNLLRSNQESDVESDDDDMVVGSAKQLGKQRKRNYAAINDSSDSD